MERTDILQVKNLCKTFGAKKVVDNLSFSVKRGDVFGFLGPNGAGKTTTIRMMLGLIRPDSGSVKIGGYDIKHKLSKALDNVGAIVETPSFYPFLSGYQNLQQIANLHPDLPKRRIDEVLEIVDLTRKAREKVRNYSLGMRQRLGIARALLNKPKIVFLDEPTNGLDPQGIQEVRAMISQLAIEQDITFFITTHLLHEVEQICNKVAILKNGKLVTQGTVDELLKDDNEKVEVCTPDRDQAIELLRAVNFVKSVAPSSQGLWVEVEKGMSGSLNRVLVSGELTVDYLVPRKQSLEQIFIELTEGGNQVA